MALHRPLEAIITSDDALLTLAQAAEYLGLSQAALEGALERGDLRVSAGPGQMLFATHALDTFLDNQRARAVITGKLTMSLPMQVDVPKLLRTMVTLPDERQAAEALANEVTSLAGSRCKATAVLRLDEATESVRLLALSDFPGRGRIASADSSDGQAIEADLLELPEALRQSVVDLGGQYETMDVQSLLAPVMGDEWRELVTLLHLRAAILFPLLRISNARWIVVLLIDSEPSGVPESRRDAVEALGVQASVALEAVRLRDDVLHRATRAEALYSTARMLARSEDFNSLLERIASLANRLLASDAGAVLIYHPDEETFTPGASIGFDDRALGYRANLSSTYLVGRAAGMSGPLQVTDTSQTSTLSLPVLTGDRRTMAAICAPIIHGGAMLGAIEIYSATPRTFSDDDTGLLSAFSHQAAIALNNVHSQEVRRRALMGAVEALASANEARDGYTGEHCKRLAQLAMLIARARGFSEEEVERIGLGAALHDIGKIAVPDAILRKPGPLTEEERTIIQLHPVTGQEIVGRVPELQDVAQMIGAHQERWDGKGYPNHLIGTDIPLGARIIAVVDTYAALVEDRPYRAGASHDDALAEIVASSDTQFDPEIVNTFVEVQESVCRLMDDTDTLIRSGVWLDAQLPAAQIPTGVAAPGASYLPAHRWQMHRASELVALNDIIRTIASTRDLRRMYDQLYRKLSDLIDVDAMLVLLAGDQPASSRQTPELRRAPFFPAIGNPAADGIIASVARLKRPLWVDDYQEFSRERGIESSPADDVQIPVPRSVIAAPIVVDDEFLGLLTVQALHPSAYDKRHVGLVEDIALHIGIALRNGRDKLHSPGHAIQGDGTHDLMTELEALPGSEDLARTLAQRVRETIPHDGCIVFLLERGELAAVAVEGYYSLPERRAFQTYRMPRGVGIIWAAVESGRSIVVPDLAGDSRGAVLLRPPVPGESALVVPLTANGAALGVMFVTRLTGTFDSDDEQRLTAMSSTAARVLAGFRQRDHEQRRVGELASLQVAIGRLSGCDTREAALETLVNSLAEQFGYRLISVYLREDDELILHAQSGYDSVIDRIPLDHGVLARGVRTGKAILIEDVGQEAEFLGAVTNIVSEIAVPLIVDSETIGGLNVESGHERRLGGWDLALIELLVQQAGMTLSRILRQTTDDDTRSEPEMIDQTTSLATQAAMMANLEQDIRQFHEDGTPLALLFIDLDHFKLANDAYGHRFGDELMRWLGDFLPRALPSDARIARYAGDAFVVTLPRTPTENACAIAETLRTEMAERTFETSLGHTVLLSVSVGVAGLERDGAPFESADDLLHAADRAMYAAKLEGRNCVIRWTPELDARAAVPG